MLSFTVKDNTEIMPFLKNIIKSILTFVYIVPEILKSESLWMKCNDFIVRIMNYHRISELRSSYEDDGERQR